MFNFENSMDTIINNLNINSKHHDKCKFIPILTTSNLL